MKNSTRCSVLYTVGLLCLIMGFLSCGENEIETPDPSIFGYEYFPVDIGYEWVYKVDSVLVAQGGLANVESSSFVKEEIVELLSDGDEKKYKIERSYKKDSTSQWRVTDIWTTTTSTEKAIRTEDNLSFIKLVFPAVDGTKWDGNAFFDSSNLFPVAAENLTVYQDWEYKINEVDEQIIGGIFYDDVIDVSHIDDENFISKRFSSESYAKGIGLVSRNMEIYDSQNGDQNIAWIEKAESGFFLSQTLVSFTKK